MIVTQRVLANEAGDAESCYLTTFRSVLSRPVLFCSTSLYGALLPLRYCLRYLYLRSRTSQDEFAQVERGSLPTRCEYRVPCTMAQSLIAPASAASINRCHNWLKVVKEQCFEVATTYAIANERLRTSPFSAPNPQSRPAATSMGEQIQLWHFAPSYLFSCDER